MDTVLPSPSAQSRVPYLRKRSRSLWFRLRVPSAVSPPRGPHSAKAAWSSLSSPPKRHGPLSGMAAAPGFKFQCQSSSAAPFPTPRTISYTCQHFLFFQLYWAAIVTLGRCGPIAWSQSSPSSQAGAVTRGSCLPVTSWVEVTPIALAQSMATAIEHIYENS